MHVRMQSHENVEISNPMYLREEPDEDAESLDPTFAIPVGGVKVNQVLVEVAVFTCQALIVI